MDKREKHNCEWCNNEYEITHHNHLWRKRNNVPNVCNDCMKKHRSQKASENSFKYWNNMSAEEYERICQEKSDRYASLSQEEKDKQKKQLHESYMNWYENICDKEEWRKMCSEHSRMFWDNITDEERIEKVQKHSDWYKSLTPEERAELIYKQTRWMKELSEEEKKKMFENRSIYYQNLSLDDKNRIYLNQALSKEKLESMTTAELEFSNILNRNNINYKFQFSNKIIHEDFNKIFNTNPETSGGVSPYHVWDFILYLNNKEILIDVDGSIHDSTKTNTEVKHKTGIMMNLSNFIKFYDSKRPYQTDGLDAYIIKTYNDKIEDDTIVQNVKTNEEIKFKDFLNILLFDNLSNNEKKELINKKI